MLGDVYRDVLRLARRCTRSADEARDVAQDTLLVAVARGFDDWASPARRAWLRGVVRKRAALLVREQTRRRRREQLAESAAPSQGAWAWHPRFLAALPRSLRAVATLASADLCADEIRWLLGLSDTAFRQRLSALRRALRAEPDAPTLPAAEPAVRFGPQRAHVLSGLRRRGGRSIATHDPDGHPLLLCALAHETAPPGNQ
jgi:RNA polymerase sigma-70 factor (ECF subfamily)